jgi:hypothetical protein
MTRIRATKIPHLESVSRERPKFFSYFIGTVHFAQILQIKTNFTTHVCCFDEIIVSVVMIALPRRSLEHPNTNGAEHGDRSVERDLFLKQSTV